MSPLDAAAGVAAHDEFADAVDDQQPQDPKAVEHVRCVAVP